MKSHLFVLSLLVLSAMPTQAMSNDALRVALEERFKGDRTGACVAAAVIDSGATTSVYICADPSSQRPYDEHTAFEIGSVTKTMTAALLAEVIQRGEIALSDPIAKLLPPGTSVPSFDGRDITVGDIATHASGLPSFPWRLIDMKNPYAGLTERDLFIALAETTLKRAPGSKWEYSNFAMMLMSDAIAKHSGTDYETLLREHLLTPLGMNDTYVANRPPQVHVAQGHLPNGQQTGPWDFQVDLAGVGGVRSTLPDMVGYLEGQLGMRPSAIDPALALTQQKVVTIDGHTMGMNWAIQGTPDGHTIVAHEGGTGGFSSFVALDPVAKRGVVLLSDTALTSLGGLGTLGRHILDPAVLSDVPHKVATPDDKLLDALVGQYRLQNGLKGTLRRNGRMLIAQVEGQPEFTLGYDSAGDFYPLEFDAVLRPKRKADGSYALTWFQSGGAIAVERVGASPSIADKWTPTADQLKEYDGDFPLTAHFALRIFDRDARLFVQGTTQRSVELTAIEKDVFVAETVGAELHFDRDAGGSVIAVTLKQSGRVLSGSRK